MCIRDRFSTVLFMLAAVAFGVMLGSFTKRLACFAQLYMMCSNLIKMCIRDSNNPTKSGLPGDVWVGTGADRRRTDVLLGTGNICYNIFNHYKMR